MAIQSFDRTTVRLVNEEILAAVQAVAAKHGLTITKGNTSFASDYYSVKLDVSLVRDGKAVTKEASEFTKYAGLLGLQPSDLGRSFTNRGATFTIIGAKPGRSRYPILAKNQNGKVYKFAAEDVKRLLPAS